MNQTSFHSPDSYLVYLIADERLYGKVHGRPVDLKAASGGARGSENSRRVETDAGSFDYRKEWVSDARGERGGPLPPGRYVVHCTARHPHVGISNWLEPITARYKNRNGFFLHHRGPKGSDGCIVPYFDNELDALQARIDAVGHAIPLWVALSATPPSTAEILRKMLDPYSA